MRLNLTALAAWLGLAAVAHAHFVLQIPTNVGFDDSVEDQAPCGSFDATNRSTVTDWPEAGSSIAVLTTHIQQTWHISASLLTDPNNFVPLIPDFSQAGVGTFCLPSVPGNPAWVGKDAILQVVQHGADGTLYQCAAIRFVAGGPGSVPSGCTNSTGVSATGGVASGSPSSSSSASSTSTPSSSSSSQPGSSAASGSSSSSSQPSSSAAVGSSSSSSGPAYTYGSPSSTSASSSGTAPVSNTTSTMTGTMPAQFTGASNSLATGSFMLLAGGVAALVAYAL